MGARRGRGGVCSWALLQANWAYQGRQFFETSTLHGVRYIAEKRRSFLERVLWFVSTTGGLMAALVIIGSLWDKFQTSPTITGLDTDYHSWDVPFPALTLCLQEAGNASLIADFVEAKWPDAGDEQKENYTTFLNVLTKLSYAALPNLLPFVEDPNLPQDGLREIALSLHSECHAFTLCAYKQNLDQESLEINAKDCCSLLFPVFTEHGFCFAFNLNHTIDDWSRGPKRSRFKQDFIEETDARWSFAFETEDPVNNSVSVYISDSNDLPGAEVNPQHIWNKRVSKLMFVPKVHPTVVKREKKVAGYRVNAKADQPSQMTYTVPSARQLSVSQRGCVFPNEFKLKVSHIYTFSACVRQCRTQKLIKHCGCLPMFYTLLPGQRYCTLRELKCVIDRLDSLSTSSLHCFCPLGCEHTVYDMEKPHEAGGDTAMETQAFGGLEVGFLSWPLTRYKRDVLFGQVDLLVAIGTIAGLFLGFSILSGLEIVYLFTLRAWCMLHTDREFLEELAEEYSRKREPVDLSLRPSFLKSRAVAEQVVSVSPVDDKAAEGWQHEADLAVNKNKMQEAVGFFPFIH